jgi:hypothetical protein
MAVCFLGLSFIYSNSSKKSDDRKQMSDVVAGYSLLASASGCRSWASGLLFRNPKSEIRNNVNLISAL